MTSPVPWETQTRTLTRFKASTDESYGKSPTNRSCEELLEAGVVNLDKPRGPTSHDVAATVRKILSVKKAGLGGTLEKPIGEIPLFPESSQ